MNEDLLRDLKEDLKISKEQLDEYNRNARRLRYLLVDDNVRKFVKLANIDVNSLNTNEKTIDDLKKEIIDSILIYMNSYRENDTNNIYYDMGKFEGKLQKVGRYTYSTKPSDRAFRLKKPLYVKVYKNIENSKDEYVMSIEDSEKFENRHIIIKSTSYSYVQKEFVIDMLETNQEDAVKRLIKKYQK